MRQLLSLPLYLALAFVFFVAACNRNNNDTVGKSSSGTSSSANTGAATGTSPSPATPPTAPGPAAGGPTANEPVAASDRSFVNSAASSGLAEVEASRYVAEKTANPDLKNYATQMAREHTSANDELMRIAGTKGLTVPTTVDGEAKGLLDKLRNSSGDQSDRNFVQDFGVDAHQKAIQLYETQARDGRDPELRAFAERTLPKLREHLTMAEQLQGKKP